MSDAAAKLASPALANTNPPPGWGGDELTKFLDAARSNQWATFWNKRPAVAKMISIDAQFVTVSKDWLNPESEIAAFLLLRCHAAFRASVGLAMAGQAAETYVQCRAMLEYAAYAVHIYRDPPLGMIWLSRHQDPASMEAQKNAFSHRKVLATVTSANAHAGKRFEDLYQRTINLGGHPNERSVTGNMTMVDEPGMRTMLSIMQHGDSVALDLALKSVAQCGMVSMELLQVVFNARFELLGINAAMLGLWKGL
jgi:hypothetical protein